MNTLLCVDENLFGTIRYLEYSGYPVLRIKRGTGDNAIHDQLENHASTHDMKVAFFTRDKDFLKHLNRTYYLYLITLPPTATQMEQARLIELALEKDFPGRDDPQFEVNIRHIFRQMDGNHVVEIESAIVVHPETKDDHGNSDTDRGRTPGAGKVVDTGTEHRSPPGADGPRSATPGNIPARDTSRPLPEPASKETTGGSDTKLR